MDENNDQRSTINDQPPTMHLTCYDGTKLTIPDDDRAIHNLGKVPGTTWTEIHVDSGKLSREARKYVTYRPPLLKRLAVKAKQVWREFWS